MTSLWYPRSTFLLLSFLFLFACAPADKSVEKGGPENGPPAAGDWAVVRFESEPDTLNPLIASTENAQRIIGGPYNSHVYESLLHNDPKDLAAKRGRLAESRPEISQDRLTYTFTLKDGIPWHDGKPVTAEDVLFSFKAVADPFVDSAALRSYLGDLTNVELVEGRKIRMTVRKPYFMNETVLGQYIYIIPKHVFDATGRLDEFTFPEIIAPANKNNGKLKAFGEEFNSHPNNRTPVGTGPFEIEKWDSGKEIVVARNENYSGQKPYLDKIIYRIVTDDAAALTALKAGEIDFNPRLRPVQFAQQTGDSAFEQGLIKGTYSLPVYYYVGWNEDRPFFKDKRVRQALTMLIDREQIIQTLAFGLGAPAASPFYPGSPDLNPSIKPLPYDPKRAAELMDQAGWTDHNGDGIRDKDGRPFRFEILGSSSSALTGQLMPIMKQSFQKAGIDAVEKRLEFAVFANTMRDHRFDGVITAWSGDLVMDPYEIWHSSSIPDRGSNFISFRNTSSDELLEQARVEFDAEKRKQLYWKWQELIHEEQPYTFLYYAKQAAAYQKGFQNVSLLPIRPGYDLTQWFVPKSAQRFPSP